MTTEEKIIIAAKKVFEKSGYAGARMQEIADTAGINKGLLHYYFKSKKRLFKRIYQEAFVQMIPQLESLIDSDIPVLDKIRAFVDIYMSMLIENPQLPSFVLSELNKNSEEFIKEMFMEIEKPDLMPFLVQIYEEIDAGILRPVNPLNLMLNLISLCVFPFAAKPLAQTMLNVSDEDYKELMKVRKKEIADFIIASLKP